MLLFPSKIPFLKQNCRFSSFILIFFHDYLFVSYVYIMFVLFSYQQLNLSSEIIEIFFRKNKRLVFLSWSNALMLSSKSWLSFSKICRLSHSFSLTFFILNDNFPLKFFAPNAEFGIEKFYKR